MAQYRIQMEDATRYLPHDPTGVEYTHYVYDDARRDPCPFTPGVSRPALCFSGTRADCEAYIKRMEARR